MAYNLELDPNYKAMYGWCQSRDIQVCVISQSISTFVGVCSPKLSSIQYLPRMGEQNVFKMEYWHRKLSSPISNDIVWSTDMI